MAKKIDEWRWNEERGILSAVIAESKAQVDFNFKKIEYYKVPEGELMLEPWLNGWKVKLTGAIGGTGVKVADMPQIMTDLFNAIVDADRWAQRKAASEKVVVADVFAVAAEEDLSDAEMELLKTLIGKARAAKQK